MPAAGASPEPTAHRVGEFVLRRWLAQGGMAELYLATHTDPARSHDVVVLKRVLPQFSSSDNFVRMFAREARLASMLRHPNIVEVYDAGDLGAGHCFFTMEYVHGIDLAVLLDRLRGRGGALPLAHALTIAVGLCAGLHYAHEACDPKGHPLGIVHRDVSPSNVLLSFDGGVKITDFGVAKAMAMTRLTEEGTRKGKLSYMSPEQATGETVDRRADVFAIATVLFELTTMQRLFGGDNDLAVMYNILHRPRLQPRETSPGYPAALEKIVLRGVSRESSERYDTALQLQHDLEEFAASVDLTLSTEALAAFVQNTVDVPTHPRDEAEFWASSTEPRPPHQRDITLADGTGFTGAGSWSAPGTAASSPGSNPAARVPVVPGAVQAPPAGGTMAAAGASTPGLPPTVAPPVGATNPSGGWPATAPPSPNSSRLMMFSAGLAIIALLVAIGVGAMVWNASKNPNPAPAAPAAPATEPAATPQPPPPAATAPPPATAPAQPAPPVANPAAVPPAAGTPAAPAQPAEPAPAAPSGRRTKAKKKKRPASTPAPAEPKPAPQPDPPSKKTSPTDTLLPILE
ncbi:MAG: protein kinase [Myxococcota bacterium]